MAKPTTEIIHQGKLAIYRDGERFGTLWTEKGNLYWRTPKGKKYFSRSWKEFDEFMTQTGKFAKDEAA
jgi:hypothetical protein